MATSQRPVAVGVRDRADRRPGWTAAPQGHRRGHRAKAPPASACEACRRAACGARDVTLPCGEHAAPEGTVLADPAGARRKAHGRHRGEAARRIGVEIVGWIRGYDPQFPTTYQLRVPLVAARRRRSISASRSSADCSVDAHGSATVTDERRGDDLPAPLKLHPHLVDARAPETPGRTSPPVRRR